MLVSEVGSRVRRMAGDESATLYDDALLIDWINDGIRECVLDNMLLQKSGTMPSVVGTSEYTLPVDVLKLYSIRYNGLKLPVLTLEEFDEKFTTDGTEKGTPEVAIIWAGKIRLYPAPDAVKDIKIDYSYAPAEIALVLQGGAYVLPQTEVPLPATYHRRIVDYCLAMIAEQDDDMGRYQLKMEEFRSGVQNLKDHPESTHDLYPTISVETRDMGEGWYDF